MVLNDEGAGSLPTHLIDYDPDNPSPEFTPEQIDFIEAGRKDFVGADLAALKRFEWFQLNLNWKQFSEGVARLGYGAVPGLRDGPDVGTLYLRRYSSDPYNKMMDRFLEYLPRDFPLDGRWRCHMPGIRVALPNGDRYYPYIFRFDVAQWRKRLKRAAEHYGTLLGEFVHGRFVLWDGQSFNFAALKLDRLQTNVYPEDW